MLRRYDMVGDEIGWWGGPYLWTHRQTATKPASSPSEYLTRAPIGVEQDPEI